jgi:membrane protein required for colicin V production
MNSFDGAVYFFSLFAIISGFRAGLLRSLATIIGYVAAMPIAVALTSHMPAAVSANSAAAPWAENTALTLGTLLVTGFLLSALLRTALSETIGARINLADRLAGSSFGALRALLLAVTMVLIFDRLIPADKQPAFLSESQLRPILLLAGQKGVKSLPPDITAFLDQIKKDHQM